MLKGNIFRYLSIVGVLFFLCDSADAAKKRKKKRKLKVQAVQVLEDGTTCALTKKGWVAVKARKRSYKKLRDRGLHTECQSQLEDVDVVTAFNSIPNVGDMLSSAAQDLDLVARSLAPTLSELSEADSIKGFFFADGVVEAINAGNPTQQQCESFFEGMSACHMAEATGHTMEQILSSGTSMCYLKNAPSAEGGVKLIKGKGKSADIFRTEEKLKIVEIRMAGDDEQHADGPGEGGPGEGGPGEGGPGEEHPPEQIKIKVRPHSDNLANANHYQVELLFCNAENGQALGYEDIRVTTDGQLLISAGHKEPSGGTFNHTVTAALVENEDGTFSFDESQAKVATVVFETSEMEFRAHITHTPDNQLTVKFVDRFGDHKIFRFITSLVQPGATIGDLRFLSGAVKEQIRELIGANEQVVHNILEGTTYGTSRYEADPDSELLTIANNTQFSDDPFFSSEESSTVEAPFECDAKPTHVVRMDMFHPAMQSVAAMCEKNFLEGMDFCWSDSEVNEQNAFDACFQGP